MILTDTHTHLHTPRGREENRVPERFFIYSKVQAMVAESSKYTKNVKANIDDLETLLTKKKKSLSRAEEMYGNQVLSNSSKKFTDAVKAVMAAQSDFDKATKKKHGAKLKEMYPEKSQTEVDAMLDDPKKLQAVGEGWRGFGRFGRIETPVWIRTTSG